jgi:hydroxyethylthiazole kinase-like uncharacterized protein yjeF
MSFKVCQLYQVPEIKALLPPRKREAHKGDFGHLLVLGGNYGLAGAAGMAAHAALRTGAGLVSVATRPENITTISALRPEIMAHGITNLRALRKLLARATHLALGPGLGQDSFAKMLFQAGLKTSLPMVIDADGLNLLAEKPSTTKNAILTPHAKEASRLLKCSVKEILDNRLLASEKLAQKFQSIIVLKGKDSLVFDGKNAFICPFGNPGMASGGMGDVLSGIIGGLLAQGFSLLEAAKLGVSIHAIAGDRAAEKRGERGLLALDLIEEIQGLVN